MVAYWLMKSEPHVYPYEQLVADGWTHWDGVRNYQARNIMRDDMKKGDFVLYYHSNFKPPHVAGIAKISKEGYPDFTAQDPKSKYFDPKATPDNPRWIMVDIEPVMKLDEMIPLEDIKNNRQDVENYGYIDSERFMNVIHSTVQKGIAPSL
ncbi:MAG: EVE domain-containing protein, partial [Candidatus Thermoplasmatota archaeon]|nr:EVE domain-containing protein [Candidatus Thermoplasmatota archaeon]